MQFNTNPLYLPTEPPSVPKVESQPASEVKESKITDTIGKLPRFTAQLKQDLGAIPRIMFGFCFDAARRFDRLETMQQKGASDQEISRQKVKIGLTIAASILFTPFTAVMVAPFLPLWGAASLVNASKLALTGTNLHGKSYADVQGSIDFSIRDPIDKTASKKD